MMGIKLRMIPKEMNFTYKWDFNLSLEGGIFIFKCKLF